MTKLYVEKRGQMIQTVRFNTEDFIGTDFEDIVWGQIKGLQEKIKVLRFYST